MVETKWSIITVTYNSEAELARWWAKDKPDNVDWIVVDNNSQDGTVAAAEMLGARVIILNENKGFSSANNIGLHSATSEFTAFVNPDVRVGWNDLPALADTCRARDAIVAPQLLNPDGSYQPNGRGIPFLFDKLANRGVVLPGADLERYKPNTTITPTLVAWVTGAVVVGPTKYFVDTDGWDESFFLYHEDQVLCLNAWRRGKRVILDSSVQWVHEWKRESAKFRIMPLCHELSSMVKFYVRWPSLIFPSERLAARSIGVPTSLFGTTAILGDQSLNQSSRESQNEA